MSGLQISLAVLAVLWLAILTLLLLSVVRQVSILTLRLQVAHSEDRYSSEGPMVAKEIPRDLLSADPRLQSGESIYIR